MKIIDNDILTWNDSKLDDDEQLAHDRFLADVGIDAPQIVDFNAKEEDPSAGKWKKSNLSKRHDSSDSDEDSDDSDVAISRNTAPQSRARLDSSDTSSEEDSDNDAVRMGDGSKAGLQ